MLEIRNLCFRYSRRAPMVLENVSLELKDGEIGVILGRNGSGKTTLFKTILGMEKPLGGTVTFNGRDMLKMTRRERAGYAAYVPQNIQFGALSVYDTVLMGRMCYFGFRAGRKDAMVVEQILTDMGLLEMAGRSVEELSGGERQKIAVARALAQEPKLLVFDEPTGNLDIANELLIVEEARKAARDKGISILISLHDLNQALAVGDRFYFMKDGRIRCEGGAETVTEEQILEIFDANVSIVEIDGNRYVLNVPGKNVPGNGGTT